MQNFEHTAIIPEAVEVKYNDGGLVTLTLTDEHRDVHESVSAMFYTRLVPALVTDLVSVLSVEDRKTLIADLVKGL